MSRTDRLRVHRAPALACAGLLAAALVLTGALDTSPGPAAAAVGPAATSTPTPTTTPTPAPTPDPDDGIGWD